MEPFKVCMPQGFSLTGLQKVMEHLLTIDQLANTQG